ncbi:ABC transporter permease [Pelagibacterium sp. 26DY04]|uniref:ABC transporter permease n=1 Tax=Pelagibacterium sp. 26DY04 TaxID=2967130 RepID=UPI002815F102|nr:ABC transporter permease [Pelagibacterium sp. 26DY04]WMT87502.1 ABC transporter permease [Pelagibacterium sp. 26DY04]
MAKFSLGIDFDVIAVMWRREMLRYMRDRSQIFGGISRTVLWLVILGFGLGAALREIEGYSYAQYILPGVITLNILFSSLQCAVSLVWDREVGLLRSVIISPAPMLSVILGKVLGGATIAVIQGAIPLLFIPFLDMRVTPHGFFYALVIMFFMGISITAGGVVIASRLKTFEGFGSISNGIIQPLYFLSGSIFPLRGVIGGVGFLDIPAHLRDELRQLGIFAIGGGWIVQLPIWIQALVYINPVSYQLDLLRFVLLDFEQLPLWADLMVTLGLAPVMTIWAAWSVERMLRRRR